MTAKFDAVLFDCDGVLVDSESITNRVLRDMLNEAGWPITTEECLQQFYVRRNEALNAELVAIDGALAAVENVHAALKGRIACASGADRAKVEMQLAKVGLAPFFEGRVFSGHETPRSKPFPDVYLAAAAALDVDPKRCLVIEDTLTGVQAGVAAGATVWAYFPSHQGHADASDLVNAGASRVFDAMGDLPRLMAEAA